MNYSNKLNSKDNFLSLLDNYKKDKDFCIPSNVKDIYSKYASETNFVLLGRSFFSWNFVLAARDRFENLLIVDDYHYNNGSQMLGVEIISFDKLLEISKFKKNIIAINCCPNGNAEQFFNRMCSIREIPLINKEQATRLTCINSGLDYRLEDWSLYIRENESKLLNLSQLFSDEQSAESMFDVLNYQLTCDSGYIKRIAKTESSLYFHSNFFNFSNNEKFIDCGAADGDTTKTFLDITKCNIERAWMIEPAPVHHEPLQNFMRSIKSEKLDGKITLHKCGVGDGDFIASFNQDGNGSKVSTDENGMKINIKKLDNIIEDNPTFIKMDIEGFELSALKGAQSLIKSSKPKMAISAYHRSSDFVDIVSYVFSLNLDYKVGLRHHSNDRWETCLYFYQ